MEDVANKITKERGAVYSPWRQQCISQNAIKNIMRSGAAYNSLTVAEKEALDMIAVKISRIVEGKRHLDNWVDLIGYGKLGLDEAELVIKNGEKT